MVPFHAGASKYKDRRSFTCLNILIRRDTALPSPPPLSQKEDQMSLRTLSLPSNKSPENIPNPPGFIAYKVAVVSCTSQFI